MVNGYISIHRKKQKPKYRSHGTDLDKDTIKANTQGMSGSGCGYPRGCRRRILPEADPAFTHASTIVTLDVGLRTVFGCLAFVFRGRC